MTNDIDDLLGELESGKDASLVKPAKAKPAAKAKATPVAKPVAKKAAAPAKATPAPAKKAAPVAAKKVVAKATPAPAKKVAAKAAPVVKAKPAVRNPENFIVFADGEREALSKRIKQMVRKPTNSRDLATKLEIHSRKLRRVLYGMEKAGTIKLVPGTSRKHGMFAHPA
ncbi:MAG: hypothetical protein ACKO0Z_12185 [Betaproteobacteria bacterium]